MPALFQMPFLARLTDTSAPLSLNSSSSSSNARSPTSTSTTTRPAAIAVRPQPKKRAYESRAGLASTSSSSSSSSSAQEAVDPADTAQHVAKRPRLSTSILSSRPRIFAHGLLSPAKSFASTSPSTAAAPTGPGAARAGGGSSYGSTRTGTGTATTASRQQHHAGRNGNYETAEAAPRGAAEAGAAAAATPPESALRDTKPAFRNEVRATPDISSSRSQRRAAEDKRSLRSHDGGSRSRSELAQYFPNWDDIISNEPQPAEPLTGKTRLYITEEPPKTPSTPSRSRQIIGPPTSPTLQTPSKLGRGEARVLEASAAATLSSRDPGLNVFTHVDFSAQLALIPKKPGHDPLSSEHFRLAHQRGERQEKQLRNIEKEKAQHEKVQLERLYEGLLGHDWLRVMGISGITDTEKRSWEQKRDWVLREVKVLLDKFERYKEEEKRLRMEKEMQMEEEEDSSEEESEEEGVADSEDEEEVEADEQEHRKRKRRANTSTRKSRRKSAAGQDADTLAAQQLQTETLSSVPKGPIVRRRKLTGIDVTPNLPNVPAAEEKPFVSFFDKPHLRTAAVAGHRRGRSKYAFGLPVPEPEECDFALPSDMTTPEARRASARMRRVRRRGTKE